jgi:hypothetical protein
VCEVKSQELDGHISHSDAEFTLGRVTCASCPLLFTN